MERVFCKDKKDFCDCIENCIKCQFAKGSGVISGYIAHDLLATLFGNDYDLSRLRELAQADREGRCVVLSEPMSPMVQIPGDTDVYCPNCAQSLSGGWPLSDAGDYRKMCQYPNCGQSIDDTKCEFSEEALKGEKHG